MPSQRRSSLDGPAPRAGAFIVAVGVFCLMIWLGREDVPFVRATLNSMIGGETSSAPSTGNPDLDACLEKRIGDVDKLLAEGMIQKSQHPVFKRRASSYCETQFPPSR